MQLYYICVLYIEIVSRITTSPRPLVIHFIQFIRRISPESATVTNSGKRLLQSTTGASGSSTGGKGKGDYTTAATDLTPIGAASPLSPVYENSAWRSVKSDGPAPEREEVDLLDLDAPNAIVYESFAASPSLISPMVSPLQPILTPTQLLGVGVRAPSQLQHIDDGEDRDKDDDLLLLHEVSLYEEDSGSQRQSIIMPRQLGDADYDPPLPLEPPPPVPTSVYESHEREFTIEEEEKEEEGS